MATFQKYTKKPSGSPSTQKSIVSMLATEKASSTGNISNTPQTTQEALMAIQETMLKLQEKLDRNHEAMREDMQKMDNKIEIIHQILEKNERRIEQIEKKVEQNDKKVVTMDDKLMQLNRELEESIINFEVDRAEFYVRFQNVEEEKDENLVETMTEMIANILQKDKQETANGIDEIYRVNTNYARKHKLPREVHVRCVKKEIRNEILKITKDEAIIHNGKEIRVLKQIPKKLRDNRRGYRPLADLLNQSKITFRWLIPEGMLITWKGKKIKVNNELMAQEFYDELIVEERVETGSQKEIEEPQVDSDSGKEGTSKDIVQEEERILTRAQKENRTNRRQIRN